MPKCKDCVHWEACREYVTRLAAARGVDLDATELEQIFDSDDCDHFHDSSRFVELPCHTGEKVWVTYLGRKEATRSLEKGEVIGFYITASLRVRTSIILEDGTTFTGTYGENVFPRKEKLEERESNAGRNDI